MSAIKPILPVLFWFSFFTQLPAAIIIDWLEFENSGNLVSDDQSSPTGQFDLQVQTGFLFPGHPASGSLSIENFSDSFLAEGSSNSQISTLRVRVAGAVENPDYALSLNFVENFDVYLLVGQLFQDSNSASSPLNILTPGSSSQIDFLGNYLWSNGLNNYELPLSWNGTDLSFLDSTEGESGFALFRISGKANPGEDLRISVPSGYLTGDEIEFAVGLAIPEPTYLFSFAFALLILDRRRHGRNLKQPPTTP